MTCSTAPARTTYLAGSTSLFGRCLVARSNRDVARNMMNPKNKGRKYKRVRTIQPHDTSLSRILCKNSYQGLCIYVRPYVVDKLMAESHNDKGYDLTSTINTIPYPQQSYENCMQKPKQRNRRIRHGIENHGKVETYDVVKGSYHITP
jgi:hypothetical protein